MREKQDGDTYSAQKTQKVMRKKEKWRKEKKSGSKKKVKRQIQDRTQRINNNQLHDYLVGLPVNLLT